MQVLVKEFVSELVGWIESPLECQKIRRARIRAAKLPRRGMELIWQVVGAIKVQRIFTERFAESMCSWIWRLVVDVAGWIEEEEVRGVSGIVAEAGAGGCSPVLNLVQEPLCIAGRSKQCPERTAQPLSPRQSARQCKLRSRRDKAYFLVASKVPSLNMPQPPNLQVP